MRPLGEENMISDFMMKTGLSVACAILFVVSLGYLGDFVFPSGRPVTVAAAAVAPTPEPAPKPKVVTVEDLLAKADPVRGEKLAEACGQCHSFSKIGGAEFGPGLYGVVGRPKHSFPGFAYSDGIKRLTGNWTVTDIDTWITSPKTFAAGTRMSFPGEPDPAKRADIIAYLRTLSDS